MLLPLLAQHFVVFLSMFLGQKLHLTFLFVIIVVLVSVEVVHELTLYEFSGLKRYFNLSAPSITMSIAGVGGISQTPLSLSLKVLCSVSELCSQ